MWGSFLLHTSIGPAAIIVSPFSNRRIYHLNTISDRKPNKILYKVSLGKVLNRH